MPPVLVATDAQGRRQVLLSARAAHVHLVDAGGRRAFVDACALSPRPAPTVVRGRQGAWSLDPMLPPSAVGVVAGDASGAPSGSVRDQLELAAAASRASIAAAVGDGLAATGLLDARDLEARYADLPWTSRVAVDFVQAWIQSVDWLLFDAVFDHDDASALAGLPLRFRQRYPLRTLSFVGSRAPSIAGLELAPALVL